MPIRKSIFSALAISLFSAAAPAMAGDLDHTWRGSDQSWQGPYIGGHAGYGWLNPSLSAPAPPQSWSQNADGFLGGVLIGYNFDMSGYVLGFELDAGFGFIDETQTRPGIGAVKVTHHGQHTFRIRGGVPVGPALLYATGGLALADFRVRTPTGSDGDFFLGFTVGGGAEFKVSEDWSVRMEYLYGNYGRETLTAGGTPIRFDAETHNVRFGVSWHFGSLLQ